MSILDGSQALIDEDWNKQSWGNSEASIRFLDSTKLLGNPRKILEVGCGKGYMLGYLTERGHDVVGVDMDEEALVEAERGLAVFQALATHLPFANESFDLVIGLDLFEHVPDSDAHLQEVKRVLKPGGHYLVQTPNKWFNIPFEILRWSRKYGLRNTFGFLKPPEHCALHTYKQLDRRFRSNGFSVTFHDIPVVNDFFRRKITRFAGSAGLSLLKVVNPDELPMPLRTNFFVEAKRLDAPPT